MPNFTWMKLGRLAPDLPRLARAPTLAAHRLALAPPPASLAERGSVPYGPRLDRNDQLGDCGAVGIANGARAEAALRETRLDIPTDRVVGLYSRFGYVAGRPETDRGVVLADVLNNMARQAWNAEEQLPLTGPWAFVNPQDRQMVARVMASIGWVYGGFNLRVADQNAKVWDIRAGDDTTPWGSHCMVPLYYDELGDDDLVHMATWGMIQPATWRWVKSQMEEAYAVVWHAISVIDYDRLCADLAAFGGTA